MSKIDLSQIISKGRLTAYAITAVVALVAPFPWDVRVALLVGLGAGLLLTAGRSRAHGGSSLDALQRHVEWCRRRNEPADLLSLRLPVTAVAGGSAGSLFRVTDSVAAIPGEDAVEILAMVDHAGLERAGVERRVRERTGLSPDFGWASFPEEGVTLETLVSSARAARSRVLAVGESSNVEVLTPRVLEDAGSVSLDGLAQNRLSV